RGGIIDIYAPLVCNQAGQVQDNASQAAKAVRIEFFDDIIESIRQIDLDSQRSSDNQQSITIVSVVPPTGSKPEMLLNVLDDETLIITEEDIDIAEVANVFVQRSDNPAKLYDFAQITKAFKKFPRLNISRFDTTEKQDAFKIEVKSVQRFQHKTSAVWAGHKEALGELLEASKQGSRVLLYCETSAQIKRVGEIVKQIAGRVPGKFKLLNGFIHGGFELESLKTIIISHHELFGQHTLMRRQRPLRASLPVDSLTDLNVGDYVVHTSYGIGRFRGINTIEDKTGSNEYLTIEYSGKAKIHVSVNNISLIQKFIGTSPVKPKLSKIGSKLWQKQKEKVTESVKSLAGELLELQAKREAMGGIEYSADSSWQMEFEQSFAYSETADQLTAIEQIKSDMQKPLAMDRLLCGDVGYGKTEVAMRAAFKAVENGKQVAVLVPTTVLCVQHGRTFNERFADFPITIEVLNRFKTAKQARDIIDRTRKGRVDILIGTHRLLSKDVDFKDLGLLIIDEEQRFGVAHKEKLKKIRANIDILIMTATPIPRTLHMSLMGLRDISSLFTAPLDRRAVVTSVNAYSKDLIRKAILHELNRQGQVFFLHNRVKTIDKKAWQIRKIAPDAKVTVAHGQMRKKELENAMIDFVMGKTDVLVCTTIIESGLDIPNANTILIDEADRFGLAQLHQLRGRVGRYKHRAYAYMLMPSARSVSPVGAKRLKAIEEYSHLGAGFRIALRDLEIRGAGNILGPEQSGHIQVVGYQMYCQLLADAVKKLRNEPVEKVVLANVDLGFEAYIPKNYISVSRYRMDAYRKIVVAQSQTDLDQINNELKDVYGPVPDEVEMLLEQSMIRLIAGQVGIKNIVVSGQNLIFSFENSTQSKINSLFATVIGKVTMADAKTVYLRLEKSYFTPSTLLAVLRKLFKKKL
ncbi:MAG: transcription-repair coupling factor, partial [Planctomycetes bacterium]|nr:transcription-repair coupling factor [Planctomycetota bacterium]